jgi:hypothetical protein
MDFVPPIGNRQSRDPRKLGPIGGFRHVAASLCPPPAGYSSSASMIPPDSAVPNTPARFGPMAW